MRPGNLLIIAALLVGSASGAAATESQMTNRFSDQKMVFDFGSDAKPWPSIDDSVMGGVSRSSMTIEQGVAVFAGVVSLENNGGFASLRSQPTAHDLEDFDGLVLRIRGDGKTYGVRLRTTSRFDGVSYEAALPTEADRWSEVQIPFDDFVPVYRGRRVEGYPSLSPGEVKTFGLIISDGQEGPFRLEIESLGAYRTQPTR